MDNDIVQQPVGNDDIVQQPVGNDDWVIATWPDGTWCDWNERHRFSHMSDDYVKQIVVTYDEGYCPVQCKPA